MEKCPLIIDPQNNLKFLDLKEILAYRDLLYFLVWRNIRIRYAQSVMGIGWAVIQPIISMLIFTVVFGYLVKVDSDGVPYALFNLAALVPWTFFSNSVVEGGGSLVADANMLSKVYFPRIILPLSAVLAKLIDFAIALVLLSLLMAFFKVAPTGYIFVLPFLVLIMVLAAAGAGALLTSLAIQYRDVRFAIVFLVQLVMYASPVVYSSNLVPEKWRWLYALNPMVGVIDGFRASLLGTIPMPWGSISLGCGVSIVLAVVGGVYFRHKERIFADVA